MASFGSFKDISSINKNNLIEHAKIIKDWIVVVEVEVEVEVKVEEEEVKTE